MLRFGSLYIFGRLGYIFGRLETKPGPLNSALRRIPPPLTDALHASYLRCAGDSPTQASPVARVKRASCHQRPQELAKRVSCRMRRAAGALLGAAAVALTSLPEVASTDTDEPHWLSGDPPADWERKLLEQLRCVGRDCLHLHCTAAYAGVLYLPPRWGEPVHLRHRGNKFAPLRRHVPPPPCFAATA